MAKLDQDGRHLRTTQNWAFEPPDVSTEEVDDIFEILRNRRRRCILRYLMDNDGQADFRDVVEVVTAWEEEVPVDEITYDQRKRVYIALHQTHVPKLEKLGIIDHDSHSGAITLTDEIETLRPFLELAGTSGEWETDAPDIAGETVEGETPTDRRGADWPVDPLVAVALGGLVLAVLGLVGVPPFGWISGAVYAIAVSVVVLGIALVRTDQLT